MVASSRSLGMPSQSAESPCNSASILRVESVEKSYMGTPALQGVTFSLSPGERTALLGPNGAGKTTLVRAISGRLHLDRGLISISGKPIGTRHALDLLGVVPQELAIYSDLTAQENLQAFGKLHGLSGRKLKDRVDWALKWIGLEDRRKDLTKTFSGGMKRRVNIACGVLHSPALLLLDEPTVGVDPQSRQRIFDMLDELHRDGMSIMLTTHHLEEAQEQCDRIIIMDHGKVIADGTLPELTSQTTGAERIVYMRISGDFTPRISGLSHDSESQLWSASLTDITTELPGLVDAVRACGGQVTNLEVHEPTLHEVFLHLTGRELRE